MTVKLSAAASALYNVLGLRQQIFGNTLVIGGALYVKTIGGVHLFGKRFPPTCVLHTAVAGVELFVQNGLNQRLLGGSLVQQHGGNLHRIAVVLLFAKPKPRLSAGVYGVGDVLRVFNFQAVKHIFALTRI